MQAYKLLAEVSARLSSYVSEVNASRTISCINWQIHPILPNVLAGFAFQNPGEKESGPQTCKQANRAIFYERQLITTQMVLVR